jgi:hypothetical protein
MNAPLTKCAHPACNCVLTYGTEYCSAPCADASGMTELACQCDHPSCQGEELKPHQM